jgi:hypothetical protein
MRNVIGNRRMADMPHLGHGVYFLFDKNDALLYIGKSKRCHQRVLTHTTEGRINFTGHTVVPIPEKYLNGIEVFLIAKFKPPVNISSVDASAEHKLMIDYQSQLIERQEAYVDAIANALISRSNGAVLIDSSVGHPLRDGCFFRLFEGCVVFRVSGRVFLANGNASVTMFAIDTQSYTALEVRLHLDDGVFGRVDLVEEVPLPVCAAKNYWRLPDDCSFLFGSTSALEGQLLFEFERDEFVSDSLFCIDNYYIGERFIPFSFSAAEDQ